MNKILIVGLSTVIGDILYNVTYPNIWGKLYNTITKDKPFSAILYYLYTGILVALFTIGIFLLLNLIF